MALKFIIVFLVFLNGIWMMFDGIHVLLKGKYFGPENPGPWRHINSALGMNPFRIGLVFIFIDFCWLLFGVSLIAGFSWSGLAGIVVSMMTIWYLPFGTLISVVTLIGLINCGL